MATGGFIFQTQLLQELPYTVRLAAFRLIPTDLQAPRQLALLRPTASVTSDVS